MLQKIADSDNQTLVSGAVGSRSAPASLVRAFSTIGVAAAQSRKPVEIHGTAATMTVPAASASI